MDQRDRAAHGQPYTEDHRLMTLSIEGTEDDPGIEIPARYEVCEVCDGRGKHVNPSIDADHGLTREDFDADPDFERDYRSGVYDVTCYRCGGRRVVLAPDEDNADEAALKAFGAWMADWNELLSIEAAERRMGA